MRDAPNDTGLKLCTDECVETDQTWRRAPWFTNNLLIELYYRSLKSRCLFREPRNYVRSCSQLLAAHAALVRQIQAINSGQTDSSWSLLPVRFLVLHANSVPTRARYWNSIALVVHVSKVCQCVVQATRNEYGLASQDRPQYVLSLPLSNNFKSPCPAILLSPSAASEDDSQVPCLYCVRFWCCREPSSYTGGLVARGVALYTLFLKLSLAVLLQVQSVTLACCVQSWFHFSFANYYNPANMNFGALRVINDDYIKGPSGFG